MKKSKIKITAALLAAIVSLTACGNGNAGDQQDEVNNQAENADVDSVAVVEEVEEPQGFDFEAYRSENPDAIARLVIPGTDVDTPIVQKDEYDFDYYTANGSGTAFTEYPNATDFCDFNEIVYGIDQDTILSYKDPEFFENHKDIELYMDGNYLLYEVVMARPWDKVDLLAWYAFPSSDQCRIFLQDLYDSRTLSDNVSDNFLKVTQNDFIITLAAREPSDPDKQFFVIARLIGDQAGTIRHPYDVIPGLEGMDQ